jgi:hypothetical protein
MTALAPTAPSTRNIVESYLLNTARIGGMGFEPLVQAVKNPIFIQCIKDSVREISNEAMQRHGMPISLIPDRINVRHCAAAFMIRAHPNHAFASIGQLEAQLMEATEQYLAVQDAICRMIASSKQKTFAVVPPALTKEFKEKIVSYITAFNAWKVIDEGRLSIRIKGALLTLYCHNKDVESNSTIAENFKIEIERLESILKKIIGDDSFDEFRVSCEMGSLTVGGQSA